MSNPALTMKTPDVLSIEQILKKSEELQVMPAVAMEVMELMNSQPTLMLKVWLK